ncbi:centromere protein C [Rhynochetos jubatus]
MPSEQALLVPSSNHFKKDYRTRFCRGGRSKIDIQPGQNVLKIIQDCFEDCGSDLTISSPSATCYSTPVVRNKKRTSEQSQRPKAGLTNSVKTACSSAESLSASPPTPVSSRGWPHESPLKPAIHGDVADSKKLTPPVSKRGADNTLEDEVLCRSLSVSSDSEDDHGSVGSPLLVEEVKRSPVHTLHSDDQNSPAAAKSHVEVENLEGPQSGRDEQVVLQGTEGTATPSVEKEKTASSVIRAAVTTEMLRKRYSFTISPPSPPPVKDQDIEVENECEFSFDELDDACFNSWFSIPRKNKKSKKDGSATPVSKPQPSEKKVTGSKKGKSRKAQVEALTKQKMNDLDVRVLDFKGTSESDPVSNSEGKVLKSQRTKSNRTHTGRKTKKDALRQGSPNQKKDTNWQLKAEKVMLVWSGSETEAPDAERCKTSVMPSEDLPMPSTGHRQQQAASLEKTPKYLQSASGASQNLGHKKQSAKQKGLKDTVAKRLAGSPRKKLKKSAQKSNTKKQWLRRVESSDSEPGEEELEREPVKSNEVFSLPLRQKLGTSVVRKLAKSEKPKKTPVSHTLDSCGGANNKNPVKALQHLTGSVKDSKKKRLPAKSSGKVPKKIHRVCSNPEDTESDSDNPSVQGTARKKQKLSDVKTASNKRKLNMEHGPQDSFAAEKPVSHESGPVPEHCDKSASRSRSGDQDNTSSGNSEDSYFQIRDLLSDDVARHKIVMPSNTPNVRRTKRIRLRPLEYWRGERVNYTMRPSATNTISRTFKYPGLNCLGKNTMVSRYCQVYYIKDWKVWLRCTPKYLLLKSFLCAFLENYGVSEPYLTFFIAGGLMISGILSPKPQPHRKIRRRKDVHKQKDEISRELPADLDHSLADASKPTAVLDPVTNEEVLLECVNTESNHSCFFKDDSIEIYKHLNTSAFATGRLVLKPFKEKGHQFVHMDTIAFHVTRGTVIVTLHKTSYCLTAGDYFYVPAGNGYNIRNVVNKESVLLFTQLKKDRPTASSSVLSESSSP